MKLRGGITQTCAALLDYSHHTSEREWIQQKATVAHPIEYPVLLGNSNAEYERIICEHARRDYVVVDADETGDHMGVERQCANEAVNLKVDRDQNSLDQGMREFSEKED